MSKYPYLKDFKFLRQFDKLKIKQQFLKIVVLTFDEKPIQQIQGKVISGNITIDGKSAMRRTANLSILADQNKNDLSNVNNLLSINKKVQILIGFTNNTGQYSDYPVIWFPQGIYVIITPSISHGLNGITISLTLHDKMAFLNGECGGTFPVSVVFDEMDDIDQNGQSIVTKPTIYQIIQQLVHHWGGEQLGKILISDVDNRIKQVMKWTGSTPLYLSTKHTQGLPEYQFSTNYYALLQQNPDDIEQFDYGEDVGFIMTDFTYPTQLVGNAGDTIVTILDQIKNTLGNYEYFYDIYGNFHFQEVKNYLNTSYSTFKINEIKADNYLVDYSNGKSVYVFDDAEMIISYANNPQYQQIKNDFIVWGQRKTSEGVEKPIRYHLAMDNKPQIGQTHVVFFYTDPQDDILKAIHPQWFQNYEDFPKKGQAGHFYYAEDRNKIFKWNPQTKVYDQTDYTPEPIVSNDFRTELYLQGAESENLGTESNYYYTELKNEWTKLYDIQGLSGQEPDFYESVKRRPEQIDYFLDFIDSVDNQFSINNIGRRTVTIVDDKINCLFQPDFPDIVMIETNTKDTEKIRNECIAKNQEYSQIQSNIYSMLSIGGNFRSAYEEIRQQIYQYTNYNEQISLTMIPIYYLEPNIRITVKDQQSDILGDYMINNISLPLDVNGTMSLSCSKATERV